MTDARKATCPDCGKDIKTYFPTAWVESIDGPKRPFMRQHRNLTGQPCGGVMKMITEDMYVDA